LIHVLSWPTGEPAHAIPEGDGDVAFVHDGVRVPPGALERMAACAHRDPAVASVSAFANGGRLVAYPRFGAFTAMPDASAATLDATCESVNAGQSIDLPFAEGGCVLVTRAALQAFGPVADLSAWCAKASTKRNAKRWRSSSIANLRDRCGVAWTWRACVRARVRAC
jgi:hypothetical protein